MNLLNQNNGLFQKKNVPPPPVEDIDFFEVDLPGFPVYTPGNQCFFLNFWCTPWISNDFYSTPWNFPSSKGGLQAH